MWGICTRDVWLVKAIILENGSRYADEKYKIILRTHDL